MLGHHKPNQLLLSLKPNNKSINLQCTPQTTQSPSTQSSEKFPSPWTSKPPPITTTCSGRTPLSQLKKSEMNPLRPESTILQISHRSPARTDWQATSTLCASFSQKNIIFSQTHGWCRVTIKNLWKNIPEARFTLWSLKVVAKARGFIWLTTPSGSKNAVTRSYSST